MISKDTNWNLSGNNSYIFSRSRGIFTGGVSGNYYGIQYVDIINKGNSSIFGNLTGHRGGYLGTCSSSTRGVFAGGEDYDDDTKYIGYITISTLGNEEEFSNLTNAGVEVCGCSNNTRGLFAGGYCAHCEVGIGYTNIDYITISTIGSSTSFGDLTINGSGRAGCANSIYGIFAGGFYYDTQGHSTNVIDYVVISTSGSTSKFGELTLCEISLSGCSSPIRGIFFGNTEFKDVKDIQYITINTTGNSQEFGDLTISRISSAACSSQTIGVCAGGLRFLEPSGTLNVIDYVTISSLGNASDFGDILSKAGSISGLSDCHGGLG